MGPHTVMKRTLRIVGLAMISFTAIYADVITDPGTNKPTRPEVEEPGPDPGLILNGPFDEVHPSLAPTPLIYLEPDPIFFNGFPVIDGIVIYPSEPVPEPGSLALFGAGLAVLYLRLRYRSDCARIASPSTHK